jgi:hypothetical protein
VSENPFQDLRTLSVLAACEYSHLGFAFSECSHRLNAYLGELQPLVSAMAVVSSLAPMLYRSRLTLISLSIKPTILSPLPSTLVQLVTPSNSISLPSLAPMLSTFFRPPLHLQLSQFKQIHTLRTVSGRGILRLCLLPSLRLRTRTLTPICSNRFVRFLCRHSWFHQIRGIATPDKEALASFTRRTLKQLPIWDLWLASEWKKLDTHQKQKVRLEAHRADCRIYRRRALYFSRTS